MVLDLIRIEKRSTYIGVILLNGELIGFGLENPDYVIPEGSYTLVRYNSPKFGREVWLVKELKEVAGQYIEIHNGNTKSQSSGCILIGDRVGYFAGERAVLDSIKTLNYLMKLTKDEQELEFIVS